MKFKLISIILFLSIEANCQTIYEEYNIQISGIEPIGELVPHKQLINKVSIINNSQFLKSDLILEITTIDESPYSILSSIDTIAIWQDKELNKIINSNYGQLYMENSNEDYRLSVVRLKAAENQSFIGELNKKFDKCIVRIKFITSEIESLNKFIFHLSKIQIDKLD